MINVLKPIFEILTGEVAVHDNIIYNYLILLIVGEIAFQFAWRFVGDLYRLDIISGCSAGSILHWLIRLIVYVAIAYITRFFIWLAAFIATIPLWVWIAIPVFVATIIVAIYLIRKKGVKPDEPRN